MSIINEVIINKKVRFSLLDEGILRIEYDEEGMFEDRNSVRVIQRPGSTPFENCSEENGLYTLTGKRIKVFYNTNEGEHA
jgi:hypothetical protein